MIQLVTPRARRILTVLESITDGSGPLDAFVEARCGDDPTVRRAVQVLAEARTEAGFGSEASFPSIARVFACAVTAASSRGDRLASVEGDAEADGVRSEVELLLDREDHLHVGDLFDALEGVADPERYLEPRDIPAGVRDRVLGVLAAAPMPTGPTPLLAPVISPLAEPYAGRVVQGLELEACIGTGGYGRVYRAWDPKFQRHLAVKILTAARDDSKMLLDEVQRASACAHPGVVTIHYVLEEGVDGLPTYAMEFMPGGSLAELLGERRRVAKDAAAQRDRKSVV